MPILSLPYLPFTLALALLLAFFVLEIVALMVGGSLLGETEADLDLDPAFVELAGDFDLDMDATPDIADLLETSETLQGMTDSASGGTPATKAKATASGTRARATVRPESTSLLRLIALLI